MEEKFGDIAILLGVDYIEKKFTQKMKINMMNSIFNEENFLKSFFRLFSAMIEKNKKYYAEKFVLPKYFFKLIAEHNKNRSGRCFICDMQFPRITLHLISKHYFTKENIEKYNELFEKKCYFYMPSEFKCVEDSIPVEEIRIKMQNEEIKSKMQEKKEKKQQKQDLEREVINIDDDEVLECNKIENATQYICFECGQMVFIKEKQEHLKNHAKNRRVICGICNKSIRKKVINQHIKTCKPS